MQIKTPLKHKSTTIGNHWNAVFPPALHPAKIDYHWQLLERGVFPSTAPGEANTSNPAATQGTFPDDGENSPFQKRKSVTVGNRLHLL